MTISETDIAGAVQRAGQLLAAARGPVFVGWRGVSLEVAREAVLWAIDVRAAIDIATPSGWDRGGLDAPELVSRTGAALRGVDVAIFWSADVLADACPANATIIAIGAATDAPRDRRVSQVDSMGDDVPLALELALMLRGHDQHLSIWRWPDLTGARRIHIVLGEDADHAVLRDLLGATAAALLPERTLTWSSASVAANNRAALEAITWLTGVPGALQWLPAAGSPPVATWIPVSSISVRPTEAADVVVELGHSVATPSTSATRIVLSDQRDASADVWLPLADCSGLDTTVDNNGLWLASTDTTPGERIDPNVSLIAALRSATAAAAGGAR